MAQIELRDVVKRYGGAAGPSTFGGLHLDIHSGEFTVLVGPSGCGKSTLLRMIAGLEDISEGELRFDGVRMNETPPVQRGVAMVFQNHALYAHMTVAQNIGFGLKIAGVPAAERQQQVARVAEHLQLGALLQRKPGQLSGGQRQRVAIGRAIVRVHGVALPVPGEAIRLWKSPVSPALYPQLIGSRLFLPRTKPSHSVLSCA